MDFNFTKGGDKLTSLLTPIVTFPWGGQNIVVSVVNSFTWQSDTSQAGFYIEWQHNIIGGTVNGTGWQTSSTASYLFPINTFTNTYEYKWRVKIRNNIGLESSFSDWAVFRAGNAATLTISFPPNDLDVLSAVPMYQHVYNSPNNYAQIAYEYFLFTGTTWNDFDVLTAAQQESYTWDQLEALSLGNTLWDSGRVESTATSVPQPSDKLQILQYWYKVQVKIWDNAGNEITSDIRTFGLLVGSVPQIPIISAVSDGENGRNVVTIVNPLPDVGQAGTDHNKLYRKKLDGAWELIQDNIVSGIGYDTTCRSLKSEEYAASAVSADGIESSKSESDYATCQLSAYWFTNLTTLVTIQLEADPRWGVMQSERGRAEIIGMDETYPSVDYDARRFYRGSFQALVFKPTDGTTWQKYSEQLRDVLDSDVYSPIVMRTPFGDLFKINVYDFKIEQNDRMQQTRRISFSFVEIEESVPVGVYAYDTRSTDLNGYWIIDPETNEGYRLYLEPQWGDLSSERDRAEMVGLNSEFPLIGMGNKKAYRGGFSGLILKPSSGTLAEQVMKLRNLVDAPVKKPLLFHMVSGDLFLVDTYGFNFELFDRVDQGRKVAFEFIEIGVT